MRQKPKNKIMQQPNLAQIGYLCRRVDQAALRDLQATIPDLDVTAGQLGTLVLIACNPGITPTQVRKALGREKPTITAVLDALQHKKLVIRRSSRKDRRSFNMHLTRRGKTYYESVAPLFRESDRRLTQALSADERARLHDYLLRIYRDQWETDEGAPDAEDRAAHPPEGAEPGHFNGEDIQPLRAPRDNPAERTRAELLRHLKEVESYGAELRKSLRELG